MGFIENIKVEDENGIPQSMSIELRNGAVFTARFNEEGEMELQRDGTNTVKGTGVEYLGTATPSYSEGLRNTDMYVHLADEINGEYGAGTVPDTYAEYVNEQYDQIWEKAQASRAAFEASDFIADAEKMIDFKEMDKEAFLASYSYLTEAEYDRTAIEVAVQISRFYSDYTDEVETPSAGDIISEMKQNGVPAVLADYAGDVADWRKSFEGELSENEIKASDELMKLIAVTKTEFVLFEDINYNENALAKTQEQAISRYYVYNKENECILDGYEYLDDAIECAEEHNCPTVKEHNYYRDENDKLQPDGEPKVVWEDPTQTRQKPSYEYAVEIANSDGKFERQVDVFSEYDEAVQYANIINHDVDALLADEQVYVMRIDYDENGEEINTEPVRKFDRDERDANELFNEVLADVGFEIEAYDHGEERGYRLYDKQLKEYFSFEGEDVVVSSAVEAMEVIDAFVYDSYHEDISNELAAYGLIADKSEAKETLGVLYEQMTYLVEANKDGKGAEFAENHKADLEALDLICNRIDEVDITEAAIQQSKQAEKDIYELLKEKARDEANENRQKKNKDDEQVKE